MARRSSGYGYNMYDDMYEKMTGGIQTGLGIANAIKQNKVHDEQLKDIETQRREFELDAPVRESARRTTIAENDTKFTNARNTVTSAYAGVMSDLASKATESTEPLETVADTFSNAFGNISDGKLNLLRKPANPADPNAGYTFDIQLNGKTINSFNATDAKQLAAGVTATRVKHGFLTPQERVAIDREAAIQAEAKHVFAAIDPSMHGGLTLEQAKANPKVWAAVLDIARTNMSTHKFYDERDTHKMNIESHNAQMSNYALQQQATRQSMELAKAADGRSQKAFDNAQEEYEFKKTLRQFDVDAAHAKNAGDKESELKSVTGIASTLFNDLAPKPITTPGALDVDAVGGVTGTGTGKVQYAHTPEQQQALSTLYKLYEAIPDDKNISPVDKVQMAYTQMIKEQQRQAEQFRQQAEADAIKKKADDEARTAAAKAEIERKEAEQAAAKAKSDAERRSGIGAAIEAARYAETHREVPSNLQVPAPKKKEPTPEELEELKRRQWAVSPLNPANTSRAMYNLGVNPYGRR